MYLQEVFDFWAAEAKPNVHIPGPIPDWDSCRNDFKRILEGKFKFRILVTKKYCIIETEDTGLKKALRNVIQSTIARDYSSLVYFHFFWGTTPVYRRQSENLLESVQNDFNPSENSKEFLNLLANPSYIEWCIREIRNFFVDPDDLEQLLELPCRHLSTIKLKAVNDEVIEYTPTFEQFHYYIPHETLVTNKSKFDTYQKSARRTDASTSSSLSDLEDFLNPSRRYDDWCEPPYCEACQSSPCMCSDPDQTSTVF